MLVAGFLAIVTILLGIGWGLDHRLGRIEESLQSILQELQEANDIARGDDDGESLP
jgi:hypothetical protein